MRRWSDHRDRLWFGFSPRPWLRRYLRSFVATESRRMRHRIPSTTTSAIKTPNNDLVHDSVLSSPANVARVATRRKHPCQKLASPMKRSNLHCRYDTGMRKLLLTFLGGAGQIVRQLLRANIAPLWGSRAFLADRPPSASVHSDPPHLTGCAWAQF